MKNKKEKRAISKLIYRTEALHYGFQFVETSELPNDDVSSESPIFNNESNISMSRHPLYLKLMYLRTFQPSTALNNKKFLIVVFHFNFSSR
jgi:hypothetical protein